MSKVLECRADFFKSPRYQSARAAHLVEMHGREFGTTLVDVYVEGIKGAQVINMSFGDPSRYPDMGPYEGVHRFLRRYLNFHDNPLAVASYAILGDKEFKTRVRQGGADEKGGDIVVPDNVAVYPTSGVAGALRMIIPALILPPGEDGVRDNVIVPQWTYLSHSAEAAFALADIRSCRLTRDGQVDLDDMMAKVDMNTQMIILATVGNPLATAMPPALFDEMVRRTYDKMQEVGHPITIVADTIYEHFRRRRDERIDAIQRVLKLGLEVPIIETSSFSKMFAIPGYRLGFYRAYWKDGGNYPEARDDFFNSLSTVYGTSLCPVPLILQKAVGHLYASIRNHLPVEEELAPVAAVLASLRDLYVQKGGGDTHTMMPEEVPEEIVRRLGLDPEVWFTNSAIAKRTRKLANPELGKYNVDIDSSKVEEIGDILANAGFIEKKEISVSRAKMLDILIASILKFGRIEHHLVAGVIDAEHMYNIKHTDIQRRGIVDCQMKRMLSARLMSPDQAIGEVSALQQEFAIMANGKLEREDETVNLTFYRLKPSVSVPRIPRTSEGKLILEGISETGDARWKDIAQACGLPFEDDLYNGHKKGKRTQFEERTDHFLKGLDEMAQEGLGVYLHPAYYDKAGGALVPERLNAFYILFGFEKLRGNECQAAELVRKCDDLGEPLLKFTPGEIFLSPQDAAEAGDSGLMSEPPMGGAEGPAMKAQKDSFIRAVSLDRVENINEVLRIIRRVATDLAGREKFPYHPGE